uniref:Caprin-1 dimerization domain-containing protein n=1 Tax=Clastoptera arizonana TaxID=38151 RepID=A0A1B6CGS7_9HEMI
MPAASSAKLEKQASTEALEPLKQGIVIIEHKIRNLEKRKLKLDTYKELKKSGKELSSEQKAAVAKYDEVILNLDFAKDLNKQFSTISIESDKIQKKKSKKEALERFQQDVAKIKEILIIQDVLANMGQENVREDFLAGKNGAVKITEENLQKLDDIFIEVSPKREIEEGVPPFPDQLQKAAEHLISLADGKPKEVLSTTYAQLKEIITSINNCGYFEQSNAPAVITEELAVNHAVIQEQQKTIPEVEVEENSVGITVPSETFHSIKHVVVEGVQHVVEVPQHAVESAGLYIAQRPVNDVLSNVMNSVPSSFSFIQESEIDTEIITPTPPPPTALPIPSQTFTNASFAPPAGQPNYPPQPEIIYSPIPIPTQPQPQHMAVAQPPIPVQEQQTVYPAPPKSSFSQQNQPLPVQQQFSNLTDFQHPQTQSLDWNDSTETPAPPASSDWAVESEPGNWQNNGSNDWNEQQNDGFMPAGGRVSGNRGYGRGGRGGDRPRGGRDGNYSGRGGNRGGNYNNQNGRGGGGYYKNNNDGGNNYYQNGYQNRGDGERGGYRDGGFNKRGGPRGGPRQDRGERGGPRPGGGRGGNQRGGRGGNSGSRHQQ